MDDRAVWAKQTVRESCEEMDEKRENGTPKEHQREGIPENRAEEMMECCCGYRQYLIPSISLSLTVPVPHPHPPFFSYHRLLFSNLWGITSSTQCLELFCYRTSVAPQKCVIATVTMGPTFCIKPPKLLINRKLLVFKIQEIKYCQQPMKC